MGNVKGNIVENYTKCKNNRTSESGIFQKNINLNLLTKVFLHLQMLPLFSLRPRIFLSQIPGWHNKPFHVKTRPRKKDDLGKRLCEKLDLGKSVKN